MLALSAQPRRSASRASGDRILQDSLSEQRISKPLGLHPGDPLPPSKGDIEDRLEKVPGVVQARLEAVCCQPDGNAILFVGIEEKSAPHFAFRSAPAGDAGLPQEIVDAYQKMVEAIDAAARRGSTAEDLTQGHALMADPDARALQQSLVAYAGGHLDLLRNVLRNSARTTSAMAATIAGYAPDKTKVAADLGLAMQDPDEFVRANAMRALTAIAVLATLEPGREIRISPTWFIEMLNSIAQRRIKASTALVNLTERMGRRRSIRSMRAHLGRCWRWRSDGTCATPSRRIFCWAVWRAWTTSDRESWSKGQRSAVVCVSQASAEPGKCDSLRGRAASQEIKQVRIPAG
jgi:hypothetical protein